MRKIYGFFRLASRLANPFGHPSQVPMQVLVLQTCIDLRRLASPFGQGLKAKDEMSKLYQDNEGRGNKAKREEQKRRKNGTAERNDVQIPQNHIAK